MPFGEWNISRYCFQGIAGGRPDEDRLSGGLLQVGRCGLGLGCEGFVRTGHLRAFGGTALPNLGTLAIAQLRLSAL